MRADVTQEAEVEAVIEAADVKVILTLTLYNSFGILHTTYTQGGGSILTLASAPR